MAWTRAALALIVVVAVAVALVSGGSSADPRTPAALPGMPAVFLGAAVVGSGGATAAIDSYGDVVDLRPGGPLGRASVEVEADRQAAGTVDVEAAIVPRVRLGGGPALPLWRADAVRQRYRPGTNVVVTAARFGEARVELVYAAGNGGFACLARASAGARVALGSSRVFDPSTLLCNEPADRAAVAAAASADRRWIAAARPLGSDAPAWARRMYERSLLTLRALTDRRSGAVAAGARDGWAYVWPRDAGTAALAYAAGGYSAEAERVSRFLLGLGLEAAARFHGDGSPVAGRAAQGDAIGWVAAAAQAAGSIGSAEHAARILSPAYPVPWRELADYQEGEPGDYLGNAIASGGPLAEFRTARGLVRHEEDPPSGLDSAAAWAVLPFPRPRFLAAARRTMRHLAAASSRFGLTPGEAWPGVDPWMAPTAWTAWSLAALGDRREALALIAALRRAATPAGALPERVDARTGLPTSTTPLVWPHAFAILTLRELWP